MPQICVSKLTIIDSDNGLSPCWRQTIIWTNAGILLIQTLGTNFSEILREIHIFSVKKMHLNMSCGKWRPFCLGLNVLTTADIIWTLGKKLQWNFIQNMQLFFEENEFENVVCKLAVFLFFYGIILLTDVSEFMWFTYPYQGLFWVFGQPMRDNALENMYSLHNSWDILYFLTHWDLSSKMGNSLRHVQIQISWLKNSLSIDKPLSELIINVLWQILMVHCYNCNFRGPFY